MDRFGLCVFALIVLLGVFINLNEMEKKPDPRTLYNLAGNLIKNGELGEAHFLYGMLTQYNLFFGTDYKPNEKPHGLCINEALKKYNSLSHLRSKHADDVIYKRFQKQWANE